MVTEIEMAIKGVLKEELENSIKMKKGYEEELQKLPVGSLIKKKIKGHEYYYIVKRENGKVKFVYKGKRVSEALIEEYARAKEMRAKYRKLLSQLKKQIKFLKGALRGQESI
jgi:nitrogen fixation/metabolism regulation signal transduction histidine kinase